MQKLSNKVKYSFGVGAIGKDAIVNLVGVYLMFYITDVLHLSPAFAGVLLFVARVWDAINDPMMGMIVDNTKTRFGKFRPWLVIGTVVNSIVFVLLFSQFNMSTSQLYIYISIMYILYGMTYTIMDVPYWSWLPNLTRDPAERDSIAVIPRFFASLAGMAVGTFGLQVIDYFDGIFGTGDRGAGFTITAILIAIVFIVTISITVFNVPEEPTDTSGESIKLKQIPNVLFKNKQLLAYIGFLLSTNLATQIVNGVALYYFTYVAGKESLFSIFNFMMLAEMAGLLLFPKLTRKLNRSKVFMLASGMWVGGLITLLIGGFVAPHSVVFVVLGSVIMRMGNGFSIGIWTVSIADVIDYGEVTTGVRSESIITSSQTFLMKTSQAFAGLLTGIGLDLFGYVPGAAQTPTAIFGLRTMMIFIPLVFAVLSFYIYTKHYKLKGTYLQEIVKELEKKDKTKNASVKEQEEPYEEPASEAFINN